MAGRRSLEIFLSARLEFNPPAGQNQFRREAEYYLQSVMPPTPSILPPCVLFEDEHLLVVNKPAGWNTHAPERHAGEGIYDWLKHREPRWASLAIIHRLDRVTSGVLVFGKTTLANRSLTEQFTRRAVRKKYLLLTDRRPKRTSFVIRSQILRDGERYVVHPHGLPAETRFTTQIDEAWLRQVAPSLVSHISQRFYAMTAEPLTGRTHQIRVHAAAQGCPILGDVLYGGAPFPRVSLHAAELSLAHPATHQPLTFTAAVDFQTDAAAGLRAAFIAPTETDSFRRLHGASDGWPGVYVDQLGAFQLSQSERPLPVGLQQQLGARQYHKALLRRVRGATADPSPQCVAGPPAYGPFVIQENGVKFELSFNEGYSVGLFLDQRDNRRRFLTRHIAADFSPLAPRDPTATLEVLNTFAYTCGFSVCAAWGGARTTSLDLSKKYLEWGKRNFALNGLDPAQHDFVFGDTFDWLRRWARRGRHFDVVVLDPPTFSQSKAHGAFRAEKDYGELVAATLPGLKPGGVLLASSNAARSEPRKFIAQIEAAIHGARRKIVQRHYAPQPPDFPISREEPVYLKTIWLRVE